MASNRALTTPTLSRREFLGTSVVTTGLVLGLDRLAWSAPPAAADAPAPLYRDWRDAYREGWRWDRVVRGTHTCANCVAACAWNLYVRDELVWREEQAAPYRASNDTVPDWNPRGCQKGASYSDLALSPSRVSHPLRRVGPRGAGRWKRISWDEALSEIGATLVDVLERRGGEGVLCQFGGHIDYGPTTAGSFRFFGQLGAPIIDTAAEIGDLPVGATITLGLPFTDGSSDDWFRSDYLVLWAFNPVATRIPDAHFVNEARYRGGRVVCIAPDYNQTAIHSDLWISPRPGTDAALALAACQVVIEEGLHAVDYMREQTDLPFLVRSDTRRFLRESDVIAGGQEDRFALWDDEREELVWAPGTTGSSQQTLELAPGVRPALEVRAQARLASGEQVEVRPVFSLLHERLARFTPERAADITGVSAAVIRRFAREFASSPAALILSQFGSCKNYHSDLLQRSQILLASLTGNLGRAGGGFRSGAYVALDGLGLLAFQEQLGLLHLIWTAARSFFDPSGVRARFDSMFLPGTLFHAVHSGLAEIQTAQEYGDPALPDGSAPYLKEALEKGHFPMAPAPGEEPPEVIVSVCGNVLRHSKMGDRIRDHLFARARLVVDVTFRMSETARAADILLPAAAWYEKIGVKYIPTLVPYLTLGDRAVAPYHEAKPEWEIFSLLAQRVAAEAQRRGTSSVRGFRGELCDLARLDQRFSDGGRFGPHAEEEVMRFILSVSAASSGISLEDLREQGGAVRLPGLGPQGGAAGIFSEYSVDEPVVPLRDFVEKKQPYPTLTGRQQFYVDHPWFLELDEALPTHKEPPAAGGAHPFTLTGGHARWSIHAIWRDHALMLRLQRGEPVVLLNSADARERGIADHDRVRVWNDLASFQAHAKLTGAIRPRQVHIFHAWEPYQFRDGKSHQFLAPSPLKVTQLVGDYGHLHAGFGYYEPNQVDRDTRVDIVRV
jgi:DMSO reductase family type II enzyme molybdopterin subunit